MNNQAQEAWKASYQLSKQARLLDRNQEADGFLLDCLRYRREAALERKLEAAQRRIALQEKQINELGRAYDAMHDTVMDLTI